MRLTAETLDFVVRDLDAGGVVLVVQVGLDGQTCLREGSQQIYIEPLGTRRIANSGILDLRVSKIFRFGETGRFEIIGDFLNLTNDQAPQNIISRQYNSPNFEQPSFWPTPRRIMIGLKFAY